MKIKTLLLSTVLLSLPFAAQAADLRLKAPAPMIAAPTWTGLYIGGVVGVGSHTTQFTDHDEEITYANNTYLKNTSWNVGGTVGVNWQVRSFVVGLEADWSWTDANKQTCGYYCNGRYEGYHSPIKTSWDSFGTFRARAGYAVDNVLLYVTGGLAWANINHQANYNINDPEYACGAYSSSCLSGTKHGFVVGAGVEGMIWTNWSVKAEYLYVQLKTQSTEELYYGSGFDWNNDAHIFRLGLNYRFDWGKGKAPVAVMAKY